MNSSHLAVLGLWFVQKWQARGDDSGTFTAAVQMRKQGIPFDVARFILTHPARTPRLQ